MFQVQHDQQRFSPEFIALLRKRTADIDWETYADWCRRRESHGAERASDVGHLLTPELIK